MRPALIILLLVLPLAQSGCRYSLRKYNTPSQEKLQVQAPAVTNCVIRVVGADNTASFSPAADGRVVLDIPRLPRGCDIYFLGFIKIEDGGPENVSAIHVLRNDKVVRELSLVKLRKLPADAEGYHVLVLR